MPETAITLGPLDHGRRMSLAEFDRAEGCPGHLYELEGGMVVVVDVPDPRHFAQVEALREQLIAHKMAHRGQIYGIAGGAECKILLPDLESERHPDLAVYKTAPPRGPKVWAKWIPEVVIEVVSPESVQRDYVEKRQEYLAFGVKEYWIVDADRQEVLVLRRRGAKWVERILRPGDTYTTKVLPDFEFAVAPVFEAANAVGE
ncbi:MAG: Uma2 family endonuclease [Gemmataceae bacterium]|nr:Uma2 family endonuclease [Gemmataceae bacterium]